MPKLFIVRYRLQLFSVNKNDSQIGLFLLKNQLFIKAAPIKTQARLKYFYGEDGFLEDELSKLETQVAPYLKQIIKTNTLPRKNEIMYLQLLTFCLVMANRTNDAAEQVKELTDKLVRELMSYDEKLKNKLEDVRFYPKNPAALAIEATMNKLPLALDLKMKLLINKTPLKFITSDHPVIKYNQYLEQRKHPGGKVGLAAKGLELFFPISASHMLCYYDAQVYKIGSKSKDVIEITDKDDIELLNFLQVLNCFDRLYFNDEISEKYIIQLYERAKTKRLKEYSTLTKFNDYIDNEGFEHIQYHSHSQDIEINLFLKFITQTKKAKKHVLNNYVVQLRNEGSRNR